MSALPLSGIKILDLTRVLAGPLSAQMLADLGAEVIKIERPGGGDDARAFGPPYLKDPRARRTTTTRSTSAPTATRNRSPSISRRRKGRTSSASWPKSCDVMMENYKVGDLKRYRLDYESIKAINPGIIYCSVTGFGQTGPYAPRAGYDAILQAMGGLDERHRPSRRRARRGTDEGRSLHRRLHDRHELIDRHPVRALSPQGQWRGGAACRCLPVRHRDRLAVALRADLSRQRPDPAAARHLGQWRHAGRRVPLHRWRVDAGGRQ